jgi:15-cis-phytoene synthase
LIRGVEMDLDIKRYQTFEELQQYCYRVASVVGLLSIEIFGYQDPACRQYAIHLGQALQLTNILRDVRNDAERGRIYPCGGIGAAQSGAGGILALKYSDRFAEAAASVAARAKLLHFGGADIARGGPAFHDRGRIDGISLFAIAGRTRAETL